MSRVKYNNYKTLGAGSVAADHSQMVPQSKQKLYAAIRSLSPLAIIQAFASKTRNRREVEEIRSAMILYVDQHTLPIYHWREVVTGVLALEGTDYEPAFFRRTEAEKMRK